MFVLGVLSCLDLWKIHASHRAKETGGRARWVSPRDDVVVADVWRLCGYSFVAPARRLPQKTSAEHHAFAGTNALVPTDRIRHHADASDEPGIAAGASASSPAECMRTKCSAGGNCKLCSKRNAIVEPVLGREKAVPGIAGLWRRPFRGTAVSAAAEKAPICLPKVSPRPTSSGSRGPTGSASAVDCPKACTVLARKVSQPNASAMPRSFSTAPLDLY